MSDTLVFSQRSCDICRREETTREHHPIYLEQKSQRSIFSSSVDSLSRGDHQMNSLRKVKTGQGHHNIYALLVGLHLFPLTLWLNRVEAKLMKVLHDLYPHKLYKGRRGGNAPYFLCLLSTDSLFRRDHWMNSRLVNGVVHPTPNRHKPPCGAVWV